MAGKTFTAKDVTFTDKLSSGPDFDPKYIGGPAKPPAMPTPEFQSWLYADKLKDPKLKTITAKLTPEQKAQLAGAAWKNPKLTKQFHAKADWMPVKPVDTQLKKSIPERVATGVTGFVGDFQKGFKTKEKELGGFGPATADLAKRTFNSMAFGLPENLGLIHLGQPKGHEVIQRSFDKGTPIRVQYENGTPIAYGRGGIRYGEVPHKKGPDGKPIPAGDYVKDPVTGSYINIKNAQDYLKSMKAFDLAAEGTAMIAQLGAPGALLEKPAARIAGGAALGFISGAAKAHHEGEDTAGVLKTGLGQALFMGGMQGVGELVPVLGKWMQGRATAQEAAKLKAIAHSKMADLKGVILSDSATAAEKAQAAAHLDEISKHFPEPEIRGLKEEAAAAGALPDMLKHPDAPKLGKPKPAGLKGGKQTPQAMETISEPLDAHDMQRPIPKTEDEPGLMTKGPPWATPIKKFGLGRGARGMQLNPAALGLGTYVAGDYAEKDHPALGQGLKLVGGAAMLYGAGQALHGAANKFGLLGEKAPKLIGDLEGKAPDVMRMAGGKLTGGDNAIRGHVETLLNSAIVPDETKAILKDMVDNGDELVSYLKTTNAEQLADASRVLDKYSDNLAAANDVIARSELGKVGEKGLKGFKNPGPPSAAENVQKQLLISRLATEQGQLERAIAGSYGAEKEALLQRKSQIVDAMTNVAISETRGLTESARSLQSASIIARMTPEGMARYGARLADKAGVKLPPQGMENLLTLGRSMAGAKSAMERRTLAQLAEVEIASYLPKSLGKKVAGAQVLFQLINPRTIFRNIYSNTLNGILENADHVTAAVIDSILGKFTGQRTRVMPSLKAQGQAWVGGLKQGAKEAQLGIDTTLRSAGDMDATVGKFSLKGNTFGNLGKQMAASKGRGAVTGMEQLRVGIDHLLGQAEKGLGVALQAPDRAAFEAGFYRQLFNDVKAAGMNAGLGKEAQFALNQVNVKDLVQQGPQMLDQLLPEGLQLTDSMIERAINSGARSTFTDKNKASQFLSGMKGLLNGGKDFGLGNLIVNYPQVPGSILAKGIEHSPIGFAVALKDAGEAALQHMTADIPERSSGVLKLTYDQQQKLVDSLSRAATGTALGGGALGLVGLGSQLYHSKMINLPEENPTAAKYRESMGVRPFSLNIGDKNVDISWANPSVFPVIVGASMEAAKGDPQKQASTLLMALGAASDTVMEQPVMSSLTRFFRDMDAKSGGGPGKVIKNLGVDAAGQLVPTVVAQMAQLIDPHRKQLEDEGLGMDAARKVMSRIPILSQQVPNAASQGATEGDNPAIGYNNQIGEPVTYWQPDQEALSFLNHFINPAIVSLNKHRPEMEGVWKIYEKTGRTDFMPGSFRSRVRHGQIPLDLGRDSKGNPAHLSIPVTPDDINRLDYRLAAGMTWKYKNVFSAPDAKSYTPEELASALASGRTSLQKELLEQLAKEKGLLNPQEPAP